ncbi:alpha/beta hydrolase [Candidatus Kapabacteria bacterium]|nr:alpha/beta hydrolase [Candidatus Kapabacteria bacterium]
MKSILILLLVSALTFAEEIEIVTPDGTLSGTLQVAKKESDIGILILADSGPIDRDGNSTKEQGSNNSLKLIADGLQENGYSSLRYDKRLVGKSKGFPIDYKTVFTNFISDATFAVEKLKSLGYKKVVIIGHGEGSLIATVTARKANADALISVCGIVNDGSEQILNQIKEKTPNLYEESKLIVDTLKMGKIVENMNPKLELLFSKSVQPFMINFFKYNPEKEIAKLDIPILVLVGKNDIQISAEESKILLAATKSGSYVSIEGMNHILKTVSMDPEKQLRSFSDPTLELNGNLVESIVEYLETIEN